MESQHPLSKQQGDQTTCQVHANSLSPHDNTIVAKGDCVCMCVLSVGWGGHLGFLQRVKQMDLGRFTSPLRQTDNIDRVCHNKRQTEPRFPTRQDREFYRKAVQQVN